MDNDLVVEAELSFHDQYKKNIIMEKICSIYFIS